MTTSKTMTDETEVLSEADEIAAMLPWYVTGKISAEDKARVDAYAKAHPEVIGHIALAQDEADVVFADNQKIAPPRAALDRLQASLASSPRARLHAVQASVIDRFGLWLGSLGPRQLAYAGLAAALVLAVQTASIGSLLSKVQAPGGYQTASGESASLSKGTFALVAFQPAAPLSTLSAFLADSGYVIVEGPKAGGLYRLRISDKVLSSADNDAALGKLKARADLIAFASAAPQSQ
jgi:anti-sigma factor RsiW